MFVEIRSEVVYEALFDDAALAALPAWLARASRARSAVIQWRHLDGATEIVAFSYFSRAYMDLYASAYAAIDPWFNAGLAASGCGNFVCMDRHISTEALECSRFNREFIRAQGDDTFHCLAAVFTTPWGHGMVATHRPRGAAAFSDADIQALQALTPHLRCLLSARGDVAGRRRAATIGRDDLDAVALCATVIGHDGQVSRANLAADVVFRRGDGLRVHGGRLVCRDPTSRRQLSDAVARATSAEVACATTVSLDRRDGLLPYIASVTPIAGTDAASQALLVFRDPDHAEDPLLQSMRNVFGLTRAEAAIAVDIAKGLCAKGIAARRGVTPGTVRGHLSTLAGKMGCVRHEEIAAQVTGLAHPACPCLEIAASTP